MSIYRFHSLSTNTAKEWRYLSAFSGVLDELNVVLLCRPYDNSHWLACYMSSQAITGLPAHENFFWQQNIFMLWFGNFLPRTMKETTPWTVMFFNFHRWSDQLCWHSLSNLQKNGISLDCHTQLHWIFFYNVKG